MTRQNLSREELKKQAFKVGEQVYKHLKNSPSFVTTEYSNVYTTFRNGILSDNQDWREELLVIDTAEKLNEYVKTFKEKSKTSQNRIIEFYKVQLAPKMTAILKGEHRYYFYKSLILLPEVCGNTIEVDFDECFVLSSLIGKKEINLNWGISAYDSVFDFLGALTLPQKYNDNIIQNITGNANSFNNCHIKRQLQGYVGGIYNSVVINLGDMNTNIIDNSYIRNFSPSERGNYKVHNCTIDYLSLDNNINGSLIIYDTKINLAPHISDAKFSSRNVAFKNLNFKDRESGEALGAFRALTYKCQEIGYEHGAILFHALELETIKNSHLSKDWDGMIERVLSFFHGLYTKRGQCIFRPLLAMVVISIICFLAMSFFSCDFEKSFFQSVKNFLGPIKFALPSSLDNYGFFSSEDNKEISWTIFIISFVQAVNCWLIWFLEILMVRRRFKIKEA